MPALQRYLVGYMKTQPFSLTNDGTSNTGVKKMNVTCAMTFDVRTSIKVELKFYNMYPTGENASTAESLFQAVDGALEKDEHNLTGKFWR